MVIHRRKGTLAMRKGMAFGAACLLALALAAPVAAGPNVSNTSGGFTGAEGDWYSYNEETGASTYGYLFAHRDKGQKDPAVDFFQGSDQYVQCTGQDTPADVSDDTYGGIYSSMWGYGPATSFTVPKDFSTATATASLDVYQDSWNECTGEGSSEFLGSVEVTLTLTADGPLVRETGRGSFHIPGDVNAHSSYRSATRSAVGSVTIDGTSTPVDFGIIGSVSWMDHWNG